MSDIPSRRDTADFINYVRSGALPYFQQLEPNTYVLLGEPFTDKLVGIPFVKTPEGTQLRDAVKAAIERLQSQGTYDQIIAKYGFKPNVLKPITINQGSCGGALVGTGRIRRATFSSRWS